MPRTRAPHCVPVNLVDLPVNHPHPPLPPSRFPKIRTLLALAALYALPISAQTWDDLLATIRRRFPSVRQLSTQQLADWLTDPKRQSPLLIDARASEEYAVSQLRDARHATSVREVRDLNLSTSQPIVVYCSVGYRSSALAEKLQQAGFTNVANLEGSLFRWANEGRPIFQGTQPVKHVHPFDAKWGQLLQSPLHPPPTR